jgi:hypothetical protein
MFARSISIHLMPNCVADFTQLIEKETLPTLRKQKGFQDEVTFVASVGAEGMGSVYGIRKRTPTPMVAMRIQEC